MPEASCTSGAVKSASSPFRIFSISFIRSLSIQLLFQSLLDGFQQLLELFRGISGSTVNQLAFLVKQISTGNTLVCKKRKDFPLGIRIQRERKLLPLHYTFSDQHPCAHDRSPEAKILISLITRIKRFLHLGQFFLARAAPGCKQTDQNNLSFQVGRRYFSIHF